jgi:polyisoprenyl-phosphate glycosyltransferase
MVGKWLQGCDYVICVRKNRDDPLGSVIFSKIYYFITRRLISSSYPKGGFDLFLLGSNHLSYIKQAGKNFNLMLFSYWLGLSPEIIYYDRLKRQHGTSRWTFKKKLKLVVDSFIGFSTVPIKLVSSFGFCVSVVSFSYGVYTFVLSILDRVSISGYASIICLVSFMLGLIVFMLGILGEYLARIYDEVSNKPEYVVQRIYDEVSNKPEHAREEII